jgi:hypothetical protein
MLCIGDFLRSQNTGHKLSHVVKVDGVPVEIYMDDLTRSAGRLHDLDSGYNGLLPSLSKESTGLVFSDLFTGGSYSSLPDNSTIELANGTILISPNVAVPRADFAGINTGQDLHEAAEISRPQFFGRDVLHAKKDKKARAACTRQGRSRPTGWPKAVDEHGDKYAGGYFLDGANYNDTGVLEMRSFQSMYPDSDTECDMREYHRFIKSFLTKFKAEGKKRLVIDMGFNGGGWEVVLADVFDQLFPGRVPGFHYRARATPALDWITNATYEGRNADPIGVALFDDLHESWPDVFGPEIINGDNYTHIVFRSCLDEREAIGFDDTISKEPLLKPEDIILLTDGDCHSSCAILTGWLMREMGVRSVAIGGRPTEAPVQSVGGTKGGAPYQWDMYQAMLQLGIQMRGGRRTGPTGLGLPPLTYAPLRVFDKTINSMDIWHNGTEPVHFTWEPAHCRLFYTSTTLLKVDAMWKAVADVAWHGAKCAPGSSSNADGTMGAKPPAFKEAVVKPALEPAMLVDPQTVNDVKYLQPRPEQEWDNLLLRKDPGWRNREAADTDGFWAKATEMARKAESAQGISRFSLSR